MISPKPYRGGTEVFVYTKERQNIFAAIVASLDNKNLSILDAKVVTSKHGYTANTFAVLDEQGSAILDERRAQEIAQSLKHLLGQSEQSQVYVQPVPRKFKQFKVPTQVSFIESNNKNRTLIELVALDRPGLLASIAQVFQDCRISIHSAKITTFGERAEDIFTVSNENNETLSEQERSQLESQLTDGIV